MRDWFWGMLEVGLGIVVAVLILVFLFGGRLPGFLVAPGAPGATPVPTAAAPSPEREELPARRRPPTATPESIVFDNEVPSDVYMRAPVGAVPAVQTSVARVKAEEDAKIQAAIQATATADAELRQKMGSTAGIALEGCDVNGFFLEDQPRVVGGRITFHCKDGRKLTVPAPTPGKNPLVR